MNWFKRKTPEQLLRENQRLLNRAIRDLDRERTKMEAQEKKVIMDIKKMAKAGQMDAVRVIKSFHDFYVIFFKKFQKIIIFLWQKTWSEHVISVKSSC